MNRIVAVAPGNYRFHCPGCEFSHMVSDAWCVDLQSETISPSVLVQGGSDHMVCHSFVVNGTIQFLGDCTHALVGQTVFLPELDGNQ